MELYIGNIILVLFGMGVTCAGIMETRAPLPIVLCWIGQMVVAGSLCHFLIDIGERIR